VWPAFWFRQSSSTLPSVEATAKEAKQNPHQTKTKQSKGRLGFPVLPSAAAVGEKFA